MTDPSERCHGEESVRFGAALMWLGDTLIADIGMGRDEVTGATRSEMEKGWSSIHSPLVFTGCETRGIQTPLSAFFFESFSSDSLYGEIFLCHPVLWTRFTPRETQELPLVRSGMNSEQFRGRVSIQILCYWCKCTRYRTEYTQSTWMAVTEGRAGDGSDAAPGGPAQG